MWEIKVDGMLAENEKLGKIMRIDLGKDKLYRVKRNYKTIGVFTEMKDAKNFLADTVKKWLITEKWQVLSSRITCHLPGGVVFIAAFTLGFLSGAIIFEFMDEIRRLNPPLQDRKSQWSELSKNFR